MTAIGILTSLCCLTLAAATFYACMWIKTSRDLELAQQRLNPTSCRCAKPLRILHAASCPVVYTPEDEADS